MHRSLTDSLIMVNNFIDTLFTGDYIAPKVVESMQYSLHAGGKRIRPLLLLATLEALDVELSKGLNTAVALECIHTYSLIHDDLPAMDDDDYRRGKPSNHKVFGEAMAILAGDGLLTYSFSLITKDKNLTDSQKVKLISELSEAAGYNGMIGGQVLDIESENSTDPFLYKDLINIIHNNKTGKLIAFACVAAGIIADLPNEKIDNLREFALNIGLAFQIKDDILDLVGNEELLGKPINSDKDNNKLTYPTIYGLNKSEELLQKCYDEAMSNLESLQCDVTELKSIANLIINRDH